MNVQPFLTRGYIHTALIRAAAAATTTRTTTTIIFAFVSRRMS